MKTGRATKRQLRFDGDSGITEFNPCGQHFLRMPFPPNDKGVDKGATVNVLVDHIF